MLVRNTHCRGIKHTGVLQQDLINFPRGNVLAAFNNELLNTPGDEEEAIGIHLAQVAGAQPAIRKEGSGRPLLVFEVAHGDIGATNNDLSGLPAGKLTSVLVCNKGFAARGPAHRANFSLRRVKGV